MAGERPHRTPKNLEGLLKFCIQNTEQDDTTTTSTVDQMDPERREWLQEAISAFTANDEITLMKKCLEILTKPNGKLSSDEEEDLMTRENALEQLETVVDIIDNANDFYKMGGFQMLLEYLDNPVTSLQWRAADVLGLCLQNNTYGQDQALKLNILPKLLELINSQTLDDQVNIKSLYALAGLIRGHPEAENKFAMNDGFSHLLRALQRNIPKLTVKTIFLLSNLIENRKDYTETLYNMGIVDELITIVQNQHDPYHEHVLRILVKIVTDCPQAMRDCRQEKYGLRETLKKRKQYLNDNDPEAFEEELVLCNELLKLCFDEVLTESQETMER